MGIYQSPAPDPDLNFFPFQDIRRCPKLWILLSTHPTLDIFDYLIIIIIIIIIIKIQPDTYHLPYGWKNYRCPQGWHLRISSSGTSGTLAGRLLAGTTPGPTLQLLRGCDVRPLTLVYGWDNEIRVSFRVSSSTLTMRRFFHWSWVMIWFGIFEDLAKTYDLFVPLSFC